MGRKVYLAYTSIAVFIIIGSQDRNSHRATVWRQELMQRHGRKSAAHQPFPMAPQPALLQTEAQGRHHLH